jgi:hypothetical protein
MAEGLCEEAFMRRVARPARLHRKLVYPNIGIV